MSSIADLNLYEILDERFRTGRCANGDSRLERVYDDCRWAEGPLYLPAWRRLVWSDIPNDRMLRWDEATGAVSVFRSPPGHPNGNTLDREGRLITCEQGNRRGTRTEPDGTLTVIADRYDGKRLTTSDYEGRRAPAEIGACNLYRADPATGEVRLAADGFLGPNGLVFSPDESESYAADTRAGHIRACKVGADGTLTDDRVFAECRSRTSPSAARRTTASSSPPPRRSTPWSSR